MQRLQLLSLGKIEDEKEALDWYNKGTVLGNQNEYQEAIVCYDEVIRLDIKFYYGWNNKGASLANLERYEDAIVCCDEAIRLDPQNPDAWGNKGIALKKFGRDEEAEQCFAKARELVDSQNRFHKTLRKN